MYVLDIISETRAELIDVLERLGKAGIKWCTGRKPMSHIPDYSYPLTIDDRLQLYCGGGGEMVMTAKEFLEKPINYVYTFRDFVNEDKDRLWF